MDASQEIFPSFNVFAAPKDLLPVVGPECANAELCRVIVMRFPVVFQQLSRVRCLLVNVVGVEKAFAADPRFLVSQVGVQCEVGE